MVVKDNRCFPFKEFYILNYGDAVVRMPSHKGGLLTGQGPVLPQYCLGYTNLAEVVEEAGIFDYLPLLRREVQGTGEGSTLGRAELDALLDMGQAGVAHLIEIQNQVTGFRS